ncbi:MAG TPA: TPM domain-containing protein [Sphingobium sp.]
MAKGFSMSEADHAIVQAAVHKAEASTDAEIVTIVARRSDAYHDAGLHWAILCAFLVAAFAAGFPAWYEATIIWILGSWEHEIGLQTLLVFLLGHMLLKFLAVRYLLAIPTLRMMFTPRSTKARRVRRRALDLFRIAAQGRTKRLTGVLIYLSLDEHRAEIVADKAIADKVSADVWGDAMAALIDEAKQGRIAEGMARAIEKAGLILAEHCPHHEGGNPNELPDRLIEL